MMNSSRPAHLAGLDDLQMDATLADSNCVVTAGAGAGKTTVLAARYVHLVVEEHIPVHAILALTFTRKAAAEMHERIYRQLSMHHSDWAAEQLEDFQNARITTLDAFCAEIVRSASQDFGYSPEFAVDPDQCADFASVLAQRYVRRNKNESGIAEMLRSFGWEKVVAGIFSALGKSSVTPLSLRRAVFAPMKSSLLEFAGKTAEILLHEIESLSHKILDISGSIHDPKKDCASACAAARAFSRYMEARSTAKTGSILKSSGNEPLHSILSEFSLLGLRAYGKGDWEQEVKAAAREARDRADTLLALVIWHDYFPVHASLLEHLDSFAAELAEAKRLADVMDFKDLGQCAVDILSRREEIRALWKESVARIMIDEFQDNNRLQKDLLFLLAERSGISRPGIPAASDLDERKLFFVGDEKQSIYRFRGADVSVFMHLSRELADAATSGSPQKRSARTLASNYRSTDRLIEFYNDFFPEVLTANPEFPDDDFSARYAPMSPSRGNPAADTGNAPAFASHIEYRVLDPTLQDSASGDGQELLEADDALAFRIAEFIKESCGRLMTRNSPGEAEETRPAGWSDFAVLLRTMTNQHRLERFFRLFGIPYEAGSPKGLFRESPAQDIFHILSYLFDPTDARAFAAVLRSPLCRISDEGYLELLSSGQISFAVDEYPEEIPARLKADDLARLSRAKLFFERLGKLAMGAPISHIVDFTWREAGLESALASSPASRPFLEHFDHIHHLAANLEENNGRLADFIAMLAPLVSGENDAMEIENTPRTHAGGVKILTIHKSKGLQFPVVIIPWTEYAGASGGESQPWERLDAGIAFDMKPWETAGGKSENVLYSIAKKREDAKDEAEGRRLLYVACTRAEDHIFFFGKIPGKSESRFRSFRSHIEAYSSRNESLPGEEKFLMKIRLAPVHSTELRSIHSLRCMQENPGIPLSASAEPKAPGELQNEPPSRHFRLTVTEINSMTEKAGTEQEDDSTGREDAALPTGAPGIPADNFGLLCHDAVEKAAKSRSMKGYAAPAALVSSLDPSVAEEALAQAVLIAERFLAGEFMKSLPGNCRMETEKAFIMKFDGCIIDGRIDLLVETDEEIIVLDFKTDRRTDREAYRVQMDLYRRAVRGFASDKKLRCGLYWLTRGEIFWDPPPVEDSVMRELIAAAAGRSMERNEIAESNF